MTAILAGLSPVGALIVRAGEPKVLNISLAQADGTTPQNLESRTFALIVRRSSRTAPLFTIAAELSPDGLYVSVMMTAQQATAIYEAGYAQALSYDFVELSGGASTTRFTERVQVQVAPSLPSDIVPIWAMLPYTEAMIRPDVMVITERGATGDGTPALEAAAQVAAAITELGEFTSERSAEIDGALTTVGEATASALGVVEAQAENLATVAEAVVVTGEDRLATQEAAQAADTAAIQAGDASVDATAAKDRAVEAEGSTLAAEGRIEATAQFVADIADGAGIQADPATPLVPPSGSVSGQYYWAKTAYGEQLHLNNAGVGEPVAGRTRPDKAFVDAVDAAMASRKQPGASTEYAEIWSDELGNIGGTLSKDGNELVRVGMRVTRNMDGSVTFRSKDGGDGITLRSNGDVVLPGGIRRVAPPGVIRGELDAADYIAEILYETGEWRTKGLGSRPIDGGFEVLGAGGKPIARSFFDGRPSEFLGTGGTGGGTTPSTPTTPLPRTLVVFGSSNGAGFGASDYAAPMDNGYVSSPKSWAGLLEAALKAIDPTWSVINRSISGTGTATSLGRFWTDVAPHRPSHVLICTGPPNDSYDEKTLLTNTMKLCHLCDLIGAVPIVRGGYNTNGYTGTQYERMLSFNHALDRLGRWRIDHMSVLDDGTGHIYGAGAYDIQDALGHFNDAGQAVQLTAIDLGLLVNGSPSPISPGADGGGAWRPQAGTTAGSGLRVSSGDGLLSTVRSFTMRARVQGVASGGPSGRAFLSAYLQSSVGSNPVRLRNGGAGGLFDLADITGKLGADSAINPTNSTAVRDLVLTYNQPKNELVAYIDGVAFATASPSGVQAGGVAAFGFGSTLESGGANAYGYGFSDIGIWQVALSARAVADLYRTNKKPRASMIFDGDLDFAPSPAPSTGRVPNKIQNGIFASIGTAPWEAAPSF